jgi:hypothetical protein
MGSNRLSRSRRQDRVGDIAHAGLKGEQGVRDTPPAHSMLQELQQVSRDPVGYLVGRREGSVAIGRVRLDDRDYLLLCADHVGGAAAVAGTDDGNRPTMGRQDGPVVDVVHSLQQQALPGVHLENHLLRLIEPGLVVADR